MNKQFIILCIMMINFTQSTIVASFSQKISQSDTFENTDTISPLALLFTNHIESTSSHDQNLNNLAYQDVIRKALLQDDECSWRNPYKDLAFTEFGPWQGRLTQRRLRGIKDHRLHHGARSFFG